MQVGDTFTLDTNLCLNGRITRLDVYPAGAGGFADVYEGDFEGRKVAIKVARPFGSTGRKLGVEKLFRRFWREYKAWSRLCHPNILACLGYSYDFSPQSYRLPCLISPWMSNGTLFAYLQNHPEANRLKLLRGIADGLAYLHSQQPGIVHGDLRADNVLVSDQGVPYLADFGLSRVLEEIRGMTTTSELAGSVRWMSPELLQADGKTTVQSDVWAFAMTVLEVMTGERPYSSVRSDLVVLGMIRDGYLPSRPEKPGLRRVLDDCMWDSCQRCWATDPRERPSMTEMIFITGGMHSGHEPCTVSISDGLSQKISTRPINEVIAQLTGEAVLELERLGHGVIVELGKVRQEIMDLERLRHEVIVEEETLEQQGGAGDEVFPQYARALLEEHGSSNGFWDAQGVSGRQMDNLRHDPSASASPSPHNTLAFSSPFPSPPPSPPPSTGFLPPDLPPPRNPHHPFPYHQPIIGRLVKQRFSNPRLSHPSPSTHPSPSPVDFRTARQWNITQLNNHRIA